MDHFSPNWTKGVDKAMCTIDDDPHVSTSPESRFSARAHIPLTTDFHSTHYSGYRP
ncbi:MAG: hypothetical protein NT172_07195 [Planctomycetota bacterium]|nr:hypothetical protein [Planctomycetota bacterium]